MAGKNTATATQEKASGPKFRKPDGTSELAPLTFVRASELNKAGTTGVVAEGILIGTMENQFKPGKPSYKIEQSNGSVLVIDCAGNLQYRMKTVKSGQLVQITYNGMREINKGEMKGKLSHNFDVLVAD